jgi:GNAT superfamily N-acetyltransferase
VGIARVNGHVAGAGGLTGYPGELERSARTRSGTVVLVRPIRADDEARLVAFHSALSARSVYLRFFGIHPVLTEREVERFTHVDYLDRLALVVELDGRLLAVGRYDRPPGSDAAEVAFIVDDEYQGQGLGTLLADELARAARERGITQFFAETLPDNTGMLEMFQGMGFPVRCTFEDGVVKVRFPIEEVPAYREALARREAARAIPSNRATPAEGVVGDRC